MSPSSLFLAICTATLGCGVGLNFAVQAADLIESSCGMPVPIGRLFFTGACTLFAAAVGGVLGHRLDPPNR